MCHETTMRIKAYAKDPMQQDSLLMLMDYFKVNNLFSITEEMGQEFLCKLESGEITVKHMGICRV